MRPLRKVVPGGGRDQDGDWQKLECGHFVAANHRVLSRRCPKCPSTPDRIAAPSGPTRLRQWMVDHYDWPNRTIKDISKIGPWSIDRLKKVYATSCTLTVTVVDDDTLVLYLGNRDIANRIGPINLGDGPGAFTVSVSRLADLTTLADCVERLGRGNYEFPNFKKKVCPITAARIREFRDELLTYSPR